MEIKIDTAKDSKEDIKRAIEFLKYFVEHDYSAEGNDIPAVEPSMFNMFSNNKEEEENKDDKEDLTVIEY